MYLDGMWAFVAYAKHNGFGGYRVQLSRISMLRWPLAPTVARVPVQIQNSEHQSTERHYPGHAEQYLSENISPVAAGEKSFRMTVA
jgi:hypothetical protein